MESARIGERQRAMARGRERYQLRDSQMVIERKRERERARERARERQRK
jgi:hypothetical protein